MAMKVEAKALRKLLRALAVEGWAAEGRSG
jgi:hypothetical protein